MRLALSPRDRGVAVDADVAAGAAILSVPSRLALQVNSASQCPRWCESEAWDAAKWDARLAMMLLREDADAKTDLGPWLAMLPREFGMPILWPDAETTLKTAIGYPSLAKAVALQRREWDAARQRAPGSPSQERWDWAMCVVRSRTFSGPYAGGTFIGALAQLFGASTVALAYALIVGGAGAADQALDGFLFAVVFVLSNEFVFGPRLSKARRHVLCPWIDLVNHDGQQGGSDVAYEYFQDAFACRLDVDGGAVKRGQQALISYGPRTNDVLLQYYGFVEDGNVHDTYAMDQEALILALNEIEALPATALEALKTEGLIQPAAPLALTQDGADALALRLSRLLRHPALAKAADSGRAPLSDANAEADALSALAAVAEAKLAQLPLPEAAAAAAPSHPIEASGLLAALVKEKRRVLRLSADALTAQAGAV